jgi:hypothetical protein
MASLEQIDITLNRVEALANDILLKMQVIAAMVYAPGGLSDITEDLGLVKAGEFRSGKGEPGFGFTGIRMGAPGWVYGASRYAIAGIENDAVQFGLSIDNGKIYAGDGAVAMDNRGLGLLAGDITQNGIRWYEDSIETPTETVAEIVVRTASMSDFPIDFYNYSTLIASFSDVNIDLNTPVIAPAGILVGDTVTYGTPGAECIRVPGTIYGGKILETSAVGCRVYRSIAQTIPSGAATAIHFNTEVEDPGGCWAIAEPPKLVAPQWGYYMAGGSWRMATGTTTPFRVTAIIRMNDTVNLGEAMLVTGVDANVTVTVTTGMFEMNEGDYIELVASQDSGADKLTIPTTATDQHFGNGWLTRVA